MSDTWVATLTFTATLEVDDLVAAGDRLDQHDASIAPTPDGGVAVTMWLDGPSPLAAAAEAETVVHKVVDLDLGALAGVDVVSADAHVARAVASTLPDVVSAPEVAELLGVTRQRVHQLQATAAFPAPLFELRTGKIWATDAVEKFARDWTRTPGRPSKTA